MEYVEKEAFHIEEQGRVYQYRPVGELKVQCLACSLRDLEIDGLVNENIDGLIHANHSQQDDDQRQSDDHGAVAPEEVGRPWSLVPIAHTYETPPGRRRTVAAMAPSTDHLTSRHRIESRPWTRRWYWR